MFIPAPIGKRIIAGIIDYAVLTLLAIILSLIFGTDWRYATFFTFVDTGGGTLVFGTIAFLPTIIFTIFYLGYFIAFETVAGASVGKNLVGLTIIREGGGKIRAREAVIRTFLRGLGTRVLELGGESGTEAQPHVYPGSYVEYVERTGHEAPGTHP